MWLLAMLFTNVGQCGLALVDGCRWSPVTYMYNTATSHNHAWKGHSTVHSMIFMQISADLTVVLEHNDQSVRPTMNIVLFCLHITVCVRVCVCVCVCVVLANCHVKCFKVSIFLLFRYN